MPTKETTRESSQMALKTAENIWLLHKTYASLPPERLQLMIAAEVQRAMDWPDSVIDRRQAPLLACLHEIVGALCYQPTVPQDHKKSLVQKLEDLQCACA